MQMRKLGSLEVSVVGIGCNNFGVRLDQEGTTAVVEAALANGVNFFDTADVYGGTRSEAFLGKALQGRRDEAVVATKFGMAIDDDRPGGGSPEWARRACEDSLRRLGVDVIDYFQLHRPDPSVPVAETLGALGELVEAGKVREVGCSNFSAGQLEEAEAAAPAAGARYVGVQNHYNLLDRGDEADVLPTCERLGIGYIPFFPLASGLLSGKYRRGEAPPEGSRLARWGERGERMLSDENFGVVERVTAWAEERGHTVLELAIAWLAAKPAVVSVIAGATSPAQVAANAAAGGWELTSAEVAEVDALA